MACSALYGVGMTARGGSTALRGIKALYVSSMSHGNGSLAGKRMFIDDSWQFNILHWEVERGANLPDISLLHSGFRR